MWWEKEREASYSTEGRIMGNMPCKVSHRLLYLSVSPSNGGGWFGLLSDLDFSLVSLCDAWTINSKSNSFSISCQILPLDACSPTRYSCCVCGCVFTFSWPCWTLHLKKNPRILESLEAFPQLFRRRWRCCFGALTSDPQSPTEIQMEKIFLKAGMVGEQRSVSRRPIEDVPSGF